MIRTALVFAGGDPLTSTQIDRLPSADIIVGADSGVDRALEAGRRVDVAVGDFDSISPEGRKSLEATGSAVVAHPAVKNETDLELALLHVADMGVKRLWVAGLDGGRPDHYLANVLLLADQRLRHIEVMAQIGTATLRIVHDAMEADLEPGTLLSVLPIGGDAEGVRTSGLRYPLRGETLPSSTPRGMSNVVEGGPVSISVSNGTLAVVFS